jgi:outer membrane protein OmpA-like peptidoglycan-associated protein
LAFVIQNHVWPGESMNKNALKVSLLSGAAVAALIIADPGSARAQMYSSGPGVYLSLEGRYLMTKGDRISLYPGAWTTAPTATANANTRLDKGWGGKAMLGYRFNNNWDVGFGFAAGWMKGKKGHATGTVVTSFDGMAVSYYGTGEIKTKLNYQVADFEAGYNWTMGGNSTLRLFGGIRFAHFNQTTKGSAFYGTATFEEGFNPVATRVAGYQRKTTFTGVGPRLGVNGQVGLGNGGFNVFGGLSGALLFGKFKDKHDGGYNQWIAGSGSYSTAWSTKDKSKSKIVPNAEGEIGLGYNFTAGGGSTVGIQIGYRAEGWWGVTSKAPIDPGNLGSFSPKSSSSSDLFVHGPFVRLVATFGAAPAAPPAPPVAAQPPVSKQNFIVFFDFDKSTITAEAQKTINQAADAAKAGQASQVTLTGHTDRSGSEQYNMALSLRRAEAVKASLIRLGVPASLIVVVGKGESQPLVPTADGVREPQNRRVEIVI